MRKRVQKSFDRPTRTQQSFKEECDINKIVARFKKATGVDLVETLREGIEAPYMDVSAVPDYRTAFDIVNRAQSIFEALPAILRKRFDNDPAGFLDFVTNPANKDELVSLGLARKSLNEAPSQPVSS